MLVNPRITHSFKYYNEHQDVHLLITLCFALAVALTMHDTKRGLCNLDGMQHIFLHTVVNATCAHAVCIHYDLYSHSTLNQTNVSPPRVSLMKSTEVDIEKGPVQLHAVSWRYVVSTVESPPSS